MYDLLLKGGTVIDPSQGIHEGLDVAISGDRIERLAPSIAETEAIQVIDVAGKIVTPGLIDIHVHLYDYDVKFNVNHPDIAGVQAGVTTMVDATPLPYDSVAGFRDFVMTQAQTRVYRVVSIFKEGDKLAYFNPEEIEIDIPGVVRTARENPDLIWGIKVMVQANMVQAYGLRHVEAATTAAREAGIRVFMHMGDIGPKNKRLPHTPPEVVGKALSMLAPGDILFHVFSPQTGAALDPEGRLLPEIREADERGVIMDTSYGDYNFGWERAEAVLAQGLKPDTIATDIVIQGGRAGGIRTISERGLLEYASFFLTLGFSLDDVVRMTTINSARALGIADMVGSLVVGRVADVSVIELVEGQWQQTDATGVSRVGSQALVPVLTIKSGGIIELGEGPHPWGWAPPTAVEAGSQVGSSS